LFITTLTIEIPAKSKKEITEIVTQLGGKVISIEKQPKSTSAKKEQILKDLSESVDFVKQHQEGKVNIKTIDQLLNEL
jgi:cysteine synthase